MPRYSTARRGQHFKPVHQGLGFRASVSLNDADDDVHAIAPLLVRRFQHGVGFPHAGIGAEEDFEFSLEAGGLLPPAHVSEVHLDLGRISAHESTQTRMERLECAFPEVSCTEFCRHYEM